MILRKLLLASLLSQSDVIVATRALRGMGTPCELRQWHIDIENMDTPGCSNSWKVPSSWRSSPENEAHMFYKSSNECCSDLFADREVCHLTDYCECKTTEDNTCAVKSQSTPSSQSDDELRDHCMNDARWHFDLDTKEGCTNSPRFPDSWKEPLVAIDMLYDTAEGCCEKFVSRGGPCTHHDVCTPYKKQTKNDDNGIDIVRKIEVGIEEVVEESYNVSEKMKVFEQ